MTGLALRPEDAATLEESTEGWAAGLQMAALALQAQLSAASAGPVGGRDPVHDFIATFSASTTISWITWPKRFSTTNRRTSRRSCCRPPSSNACAPRCALRLPGLAMGAPPARQRVLRHLVLSWTTSSAPTCSWCRWMASSSGTTTATSSPPTCTRPPAPGFWPSRVADLHVRASAWYAAQRLERGSHPPRPGGAGCRNAARLVEQNVQEFIERGRLAQVMDWVDALPPQVAHNRPRLCVELSWALTFASQVQQAAPFLRDAEAALDAWQAAPLARDAGAAPLAGDRLDQVKVSRCAPALLS